VLERDLVLPGTSIFGRNSQSGEAKAVIAEFTVLNGTKDLVSLALASRAGNEASLVVEVSVDVAVSGRGAAEASDV